jgi:hypothetical protein
MDEFRKPYEYEDEKGVSGFLLIFFLMVIAIEPFQTIIAIFFGYANLELMPVLRIVYVIISILLICFSLFTAVALKKIQKKAVSIVKIYLIFRLIYFIPFTIFNTIYQIKHITIQVTDSRYNGEYTGIIYGFAISIVYVLAFSALWYLYFQKSKKVKTHYLNS